MDDLKKTESTEFPYEKFNIKLFHTDGKEKRVCYFECDAHLKKYISRYNLKKKDIKILIKEDKND
jgi:hypothetical protein